MKRQKVISFKFDNIFLLGIHKLLKDNLQKKKDNRTDHLDKYDQNYKRKLAEKRLNLKRYEMIYNRKWIQEVKERFRKSEERLENFKVYIY